LSSYYFFKGSLMNKITQTILPFALYVYLSVSGCANIATQEANNNGTTQWDFDHHVQFKQTKLAEQYYQLEIIPNHKVKFERLASFLIRQSYSLCGSYYYKLEMIEGIESFDDKDAMPNYIFSSLTAKVEC
jgi:hypothetical protein